MTLTLGYKASAEQFGPAQLADFAVLAEEVGFDSVFISDHLQPWVHDGGHAPAAVPWLGAVGARTSTIAVGTSVLTPTFRYNPTVIAQQFATLGAMYPGRVILGVGTGEALNEQSLGIAWPDPPERFQRLKEAVLLIQRLWRETDVTHEGTFYTANDMNIYDRPETPVPIYIGAAGPAAARLAGRIADGFITTSGKKRELYTETLLPAVAEGLEKAGRAGDGVDRMIEVKVSLADSVDEARERTRFWAPLALSPDEKMSIHDPREMQRLAASLPIERVAQRFICSDDVEAHVHEIEWYVDQGFTHLVFHDPGFDQEAFLRRYGAEVLPRLRQRAAERDAATPAS